MQDKTRWLTGLAVIGFSGFVLFQVGAHARGTEGAIFAAKTAPAQRAAEVADALARSREPDIDWVGVDLDGDGAPDFVNPTGRAPRTLDAYGHGHYGASRDGGSRKHGGVDYAGRAGQSVVAPMSGFVTKVGYAAAGKSLVFVEISNPALKHTVRVFYIEPEVAVGDAVALGDRIGALVSLQGYYPGITDHVHLEVMGPRGRLDPDAVIVAQAREPRGRGRG